MRDTSGSRPRFFHLQKKSGQSALYKLFQQDRIGNVKDEYLTQQEEYFAITHPGLVFQPNFKNHFLNHIAELKKEAPIWQHGRWVYFPWNTTLIHILEEHAFYKVRTARNRNLITEEEQDNFYHSHIGIIGLSIGHSIALTLTMEGGGRHIKLVDFDSLALSNLNRIRTGINNLGLKKTEIAAREIYAINPYAEIEVFGKGLTRDNLLDFFQNLDIVVDEMDDFPMKVLIREYAKKKRIPVITAIDNGDSGVIDIERYDLNPKTEFFHGRIGKTNYKELLQLDKRGIGRKLAQLVGIENHTERMLNSLIAIGKTIVSWPQLGGTALINGAAVAYCVRRILNNQPLERNRAIISLDEKLIPNFNSKSKITKRKKVHAEFRKIFGL